MTGMGTRSARLLLPALGLALLAAGCGSKDSGPDPAPAADSLAQGLASGDPSPVAFAGATPASVQRQYAAAVAGLGDVKPEVAVATVSKEGDSRATATLRWTWPLGQ